MKKFKKIMTVVILVLVSLTLFHTLNYYFPKNIVRRTLNGLNLVITPVLIAGILVYLVNPFTTMLINKYKMNKKLAILLTIALLIISLAGILTFIGFFIVNQGRELIDAINNPGFIQDVEAWFNKYNLLGVYDNIINFIRNFEFTSLLGPATSVLSKVVQALTAIILVPIFLWHFLNYKERILESVNNNIPVTWQEHVMPITDKSNRVLASYFRSKILSIIMLFIMFIFVYLILGLPIGYVILFAILISLLDLIPYLGPTSALLIPIIYIFSADGINLLYQSNWHLDPISANILLLGINVVIQVIQGNYIVPKLAGKEMDINPALILVFMLFFGSILGIWGIVLSIPLGGIVLVVWNHIKESGFLDNEKES